MHELPILQSRFRLINLLQSYSIDHFIHEITTVSGAPVRDIQAVMLGDSDALRQLERQSVIQIAKTCIGTALESGSKARTGAGSILLCTGICARASIDAHAGVAEDEWPGTIEIVSLEICRNVMSEPQLPLCVAACGLDILLSRPVFGYAEHFFQLSSGMLCTWLAARQLAGFMGVAESISASLSGPDIVATCADALVNRRMLARVTYLANANRNSIVSIRHALECISGPTPFLDHVEQKINKSIGGFE